MNPQTFGQNFNFTPQAITYDWVAGEVYALGYNNEQHLVISKTSPIGGLDLVYTGPPVSSDSLTPVLRMTVDPYRG